jgi:methyl-accepting chemotaxis protein
MSDQPKTVMDAVTSIARNITQLTDVTVNLVRDVKALRDGQAELQESLGRARVDLMERMDRMQDAVTGIRDDISVNFGASEATRRVQDNTRNDMRDWVGVIDSMRDQMAGMERQIQRLQTQVRELKGDP